MTRPGQSRAKIVATLGPTSSDAGTIRSLVDAGADVFRLNFSHGSHAEHRERYEIIRRIEAEVGRPLGVLADPIRSFGPCRRLVEPLTLAPGERLRFDVDHAPGTHERVPLPHPEVLAALAPGVQLLLDDGKLRLEVEETGPETAIARVMVGGHLSDRKGVSVVGAVLAVSALTDKDRRDLEHIPIAWNRRL